MLKLIIAALAAVSLAACGEAVSKPPHLDRPAEEESPCDEGYSFDKGKGVCFRDLERKLFKKEPCKVGSTKEFREADGRITVRRCHFVK